MFSKAMNLIIKLEEGGKKEFVNDLCCCGLAATRDGLNRLLLEMIVRGLLPSVLLLLL